jgi:hypothetical protein
MWVTPPPPLPADEQHMRLRFRAPVLAAALAASALTPAAAQANWHATVLFRGTYDVQESSPGGTVLYSMHSSAQLTGTWDMGIGLSPQTVAAYPSSGTVRYAISASGTKLACGIQRHFTDRAVGRPGFATMTMMGSGAQLPVTYQWSGDRIDRVWDSAAGQDDCGMPAGVEEGTGGGDLPGTMAMAKALGIPLTLSKKSFLEGHTTSLVMHLNRAWHHGGTVRRLRGLWSIVFQQRG